MQLLPQFITAFALPGFLARSSLLPSETGSLGGQRTAVATCASLQSLLGSDVVHSAGKLYSHTATNAWNLFNTEQRPSCIVFPLNSQDVQEAMRAIFRGEVRYAVQAGGHTAMKGWNNVQNGVLISFSRMSNITYNPEKDTITLQPGIHWGDAVAQMEPFGVAPAGGRVTDVGTGLLLGGGLSYLAAEHGFSSDTLKEADVVLVNGDLVTASAEPTNAYRDLFHALKGGANRFGIVTRYEVHAIHTGTKDDKRWFGGVIMYPNSSAEAVVKATANYVRTVNDPKTAILVGLIYTFFEGQIGTSHFATVFYNGTSLPNDIFGEFLSIPSTASFLSAHSYSEVSSILGAGDTRGFGEVFGASVLDSSPASLLSAEDNEAQYMNAFTRYTNFTTTFKDSLNATVLAFTPVLDCQVAASRARGGNVIDPPRGGYAALQFQVQYPFGQLTVPEEVEEGRQLMLKQIPPAPGLPLYIAESDAKQEVFKSYGQFEFMKATYEKYDPTRFNVRFTDGPLGL